MDAGWSTVDDGLWTIGDMMKWRMDMMMDLIIIQGRRMGRMRMIMRMGMRTMIRMKRKLLPKLHQRDLKSKMFVTVVASNPCWSKSIRKVLYQKHLGLWGIPYQYCITHPNQPRNGSCTSSLGQLERSWGWEHHYKPFQSFSISIATAA